MKGVIEWSLKISEKTIILKLSDLKAITKSITTRAVSYTHLQIGIGACKQVQFIMHLWVDENKGEKEILKSHYVNFDFRDTDISIAKKMVEITNIINGEIDPFEED